MITESEKHYRISLENFTRFLEDQQSKRPMIGNNKSVVRLIAPKIGWDMKAPAKPSWEKDPAEPGF